MDGKARGVRCIVCIISAFVANGPQACKLDPEGRWKLGYRVGSCQISVRVLVLCVHTFWVFPGLDDFQSRSDQGACRPQGGTDSTYRCDSYVHVYVKSTCSYTWFISCNLVSGGINLLKFSSNFLNELFSNNFPSDLFPASLSPACMARPVRRVSSVAAPEWRTYRCDSYVHVYVKSTCMMQRTYVG